MKTQIEKSDLFRKLHVKGNPLVLFNVWDVASAQCLQEAGAKAIATSSWSVAAAYGYEDGEKCPLHLAIENIKRIVNAVDLPVTMDFEGGYANTLEVLEKNIAMVIDTGIVGINFEDQVVGKHCLYSIEEQSERIGVIRKVSQSVPFFINARTDIFLQENDTEQQLQAALTRAKAYASAGADSFFVPGLHNIDAIAKLCDLSPIPVNVMLGTSNLTINMLKEVGVARVSYGPSPFFHVMQALKENMSTVLTKS